ncbi:MAG: DUF3500 domain-containing protein [Chloroflexi bacterium]|nr:DUF3500 domain-containing protein [Chloroflexota bacterium]
MMSTNNAIHTRLIYGILATVLLAGCSTPAAPTAKPAAPVSQSAQPTIAPAAPQQTQPTTAPAPSANAATAAPASAGDTTPKIVAAAQAFLTTLNDAQRSKVQFDFNNNTQRAKWSNFPTGIFQRAGVRWGDLNQAQRDAVMTMLKVSLSDKGYQQVIDVMTGDEVLKSTDGGGNLVFGQNEYYVSILGAPSATAPWMWQFGGHHFALNATIVGGNVTLAPSLTGGQPVKYTIGGKAVQTVVAETEKSFQLINALNAEQQKKAIIGSRVIDLVLGPGQDGKKINPQGIKASELSADQQNLLLELLNTRVGLLNEEDAALKMAEIRTGLNDTYFAWSGPTAVGSASYFRIQGPTVIMEYSPQSMGGDATNHIHSMYRDPQNDYGAKWR